MNIKTYVKCEHYIYKFELSFMGKTMEVFEKTFVTNMKRIGKVIAKFYNIPLFEISNGNCFIFLKALLHM